MKPPKCVLAVLDKPGKYSFEDHGYLWYFEVDEERRVHQLKPDTLKRDGVLSYNGWNCPEDHGKVEPIEGRLM